MSKDKYGIPSLKRDFPTDDKCLDFIFETLHSRKCSCGGEYRRVDGRKQYYCSNCRHQIAPLAGTIFRKSDTPLTLWFQAVLLFSNGKSGISARMLQRDLEVTYKTAWRILSQIKKALKQHTNPLTGEIEIDSAFVGGHRYAGKNNEQMGKAMMNKSVVTVAVQRGGEMRAKVNSDVSADSLEDFIRDNVKPGSTLYTDNAKGYRRLAKSYRLEAVDHSKGEYARGKAHVNAIETFFSHLKRSIKGTFKGVSKQHLQSYLDAFVFHYNNRHSDKERFVSLLGTLLQPVG